MNCHIHNCNCTYIESRRTKDARANNAQASLDPVYGEIGVTTSSLEKYPELKDFLEDIKKYMMFFDHKVKLIDNEPCFLKDGDYVSWTELKKTIYESETPSKYIIPHGWRYIEGGLQKQNLVKWEELTPCWKDKNGSASGHYYLDVITHRKKGILGKLGHCSLRLIDDNQNVYSVGLLGRNHIVLPLRHLKGKIFSPDPFEFIKESNKNVTSTRLEISKVQFERLKTKIESDQRNNNLHFHFSKRNCSVYATEVINEIGINLFNKEFPSQAIARSVLSKLHIKLPDWALKVIHVLAQAARYVLSVCFLALAFLFGYFYTDKNTPALQNKVQKSPPLSLDIFRFGTAWKVLEWQKFVEKQRSGYLLKNPDFDKSKIHTMIPKLKEERDQRCVMQISNNTEMVKI